MTRWARLLAVLVLGLALSACGVVRGEQPAGGQTVWVTAGSGLGQSFTAEWDRLQALRVHVNRAATGEGVLALAVYDHPTAGAPLAQAEIPLGALQGGWTELPFPPLADSRGRDLFVSLTIHPAQPAAEVGLAAAGPETYLDGALYRLDERGAPQPQEAQLAFALVYAWQGVARGLAADLAQAGLVLLGGLWLWVLPGLGLLAAAGLLKKLDILEAIALGAGAGLALYPVLMAWGQATAWLLPAALPEAAWSAGLLVSLPPLAGLALLAWRRRDLRLPQRLSGGGLLLLAVVVLVFGVRFWLVRGLALPLGGDAYSHTVMTQLILEHGGLFDSWLPYAPYSGLSIQFGFPAAAAGLAWLLKLQAAPAVIAAGQLANGLAVLALYPLARRFAGPERPLAAQLSGAAGLIIAGLVSTQPEYYVNWGRYAQLSGQVILPLAVWLAWEVLDGAAPKNRAAPAWAAALLLGLVTAGMVLHYYRMAFFFVSLAAPLAAWRLFARRAAGERAAGWRALWAALGRVTLAAAAAGLFFLPWIGQVSGTHLGGLIVQGVARQRPLDAALQDFENWQILSLFVPAWQVWLGVLGGLWALLRRSLRAAAVVTGLGYALLALYRLGTALRLPGANMMDVFTTIIFLYFPVALLAGLALGDLGAALARRSRAAQAVVLLALLGAAAWGALVHKNMLNPFERSLATRADQRAFAWIARNLPPDAGAFLVQSFTYRWNSINASDGGLWLPLLAPGHTATTPAQYAHINEKPIEADYNQRITALVALLEQGEMPSEPIRQALCGLDVGYAYLGQRRGLVGIPGPALFSEQELANSAWFDLVYAQDRVRIFALRAGVCP